MHFRSFPDDQPPDLSAVYCSLAFCVQVSFVFAAVFATTLCSFMNDQPCWLESLLSVLAQEEAARIVDELGCSAVA